MNSNPLPDRSALALLREPGFLSRNLKTVVSKAASLAILASLALTAWVVFSFLRISWAGGADGATAQTAVDAVPARGADDAGSARREPLVYLSGGDTKHYHLCG